MFRKQNFQKKRYFWYNKSIFSLFGPFQALFDPFLTTFSAKTPFLALVGETFSYQNSNLIRIMRVFDFKYIKFMWF